MYICIYNISVHVSGDFLPKNLFMGNLLGDIYRKGLLYMEELMIRSCQGRVELYKFIFQ